MKDIREQLSGKEVAEIDFRTMGQQVRNAAVELSLRTNRELLQPMSEWLDDPEFMKKHALIMQDGVSWAEYKRQQRDAAVRINRDQQAEALRRYWAAVKRKKQLLEQVAQIIPKRTSHSLQCPKGTDARADQGWLTAALGPFSHSAEHSRRTAQEFQAVQDMPLSASLPWRTVLRAELSAQRRFIDLPTLHPEDQKKDTVAKFCHLLEMDQQGEVDLEQDASGDITVRPCVQAVENTVIVKDQAGNEMRLDWGSLSEAQREKVLRDAREHKIICKTEG